jgi:hypothetical protein
MAALMAEKYGFVPDCGTRDIRDIDHGLVHGDPTGN